jgi:hypothetical protein
MDHNRGAMIHTPGDVAAALWPRVSGASRRPLFTTFRDDRAEHAKIVRFFD